VINEQFKKLIAAINTIKKRIVWQPYLIHWLQKH